MSPLLRSVLIGAAVYCGAAAPSLAAPLQSLHITYKETLTRAKQKPTSRTSEMWLKNHKMKIRQGNMNIISDGKKSYLFLSGDPQKRMRVMNLPPNQQMKSITANIGQMVNPLLKNMKKVGKGRMLNHPVDIYQSVNAKEKATNKSWVATIQGAPIFLREERRRPEGTLIIEATGIRVNPAVPDRLFAPPAGYKAVPVSAPRPGGAPPARR